MQQRGENPPISVDLRIPAVESILGRFRGAKVLLIGIGGGGDVVGTLPTLFDLERLGATVTPAGLTWKRIVHDPIGRPRPLDEFENISRVNDLIAEANPETTPRDSSPHIEALVSKALHGRPIAMIDITPGARALADALAEYRTRRGFDSIIGIDAGGDVLCAGHESTLESPICDQTMLCALSTTDDALLGVFGFGADGEMTLSDLHLRFSDLAARGAYLGAIPVHGDDIPRIEKILVGAPTEASRLPITIARALTPQRLQELSALLRVEAPALHEVTATPTYVPMREGLRTAHLSDLSATTMFFRAREVFTSSRFASLVNPLHSIDTLREVLHTAGITSEFTEKERLRSDEARIRAEVENVE